MGDSVKTRRKSSQREKIYEIILSGRSHPTALDLYEMIRREMPAASLGNIYRNLGILVEDGRLIKIKFGDDTEHYDATVSVHYHFACRKCGNVMDLEMPVQEDIIAKAQKFCGHELTGHSIQFFGTCEKCKNIIKKGKTKK